MQVPLTNSPRLAAPPGLTPSPTDMAIALATIHEQGRLFSPMKQSVEEARDNTDMGVGK